MQLSTSFEAEGATATSHANSTLPPPSFRPSNKIKRRAKGKREEEEEDESPFGKKTCFAAEVAGREERHLTGHSFVRGTGY